MTKKKIDADLETIGIDELAKILKKSRASVKSDLSRCPDRLPPSIKPKGGRVVLFRVKDVKDWLADQAE